MGKSKKATSSDVEEAVSEIMGVIDEHELSGASVARTVTVEFLKDIASECRERAQTITEEMEGEGEEDDEEGGSEDDEDE